eukprot:CAMPEP_0119260284 /NCGR_PEP_ID=MMETSP1329-20130426/746_1 /TAXON_ID=114041 /ORGANISM="Genus nov. species nov., Strain RCC1024" /LENGTH=212 /DNA_ID=CAMNT_0007259705 /DNA_START=209 /DNA_END=847 /DNA_ORIENTATION=-
MKALLALCAFTTTLAFRAARPRRRAVPTLMPASRVSRFFLGDRSKAPLRALVKSKLEKSTFGFAPELVDIAVDAGFEQLEAAAQRRGLDAVESGALQKQRDAISRDVAKKVAATIETPLGDALEEKLAGAVVDALLDQVMENASFLRGPADRLAALEEDVADVKAEMGLVRLVGYRLRTNLFKVLPGLLVGVAVVAGLRSNSGIAGKWMLRL